SVQLPQDTFFVSLLSPADFPGTGFVPLSPLSVFLQSPCITPSNLKIKHRKAVFLAKIVVYQLICDVFVFIPAQFNYIIEIAQFIFSSLDKHIWVFNNFDGGKLHYFSNKLPMLFISPACRNNSINNI